MPPSLFAPDHAHIVSGDDLDQHVAALGECGFIPEETEDVPGKHRKVSFRDPEGNTIAFGHLFQKTSNSA
jgi:hypothetical protein